MKEIRLELTAFVKGTNCRNEEFEVQVDFKLIPPNNDEYYGTGYYMEVLVGPSDEHYIDVRYEGTIDIKELATRFIRGFFGRNCKEFRFED